MTRPGVVVTSRADLPPRSAPTDAGMAFMVGKSTATAVDTVSSFSEYVSAFGDRTSAQAAYDAAETFFREGGAKLTVSPAATPDLTGVDGALDALTKDY